MSREANFGNTITAILTKKKERGERNDGMEVREKNKFR